MFAIKQELTQQMEKEPKNVKLTQSQSQKNYNASFNSSNELMNSSNVYAQNQFEQILTDIS